MRVLLVRALPLVYTALASPALGLAAALGRTAQGHAAQGPRLPRLRPAPLLPRPLLPPQPCLRRRCLLTLRWRCRAARRGWLRSGHVRSRRRVSQSTPQCAPTRAARTPRSPAPRLRPLPARVQRLRARRWSAARQCWSRLRLRAHSSHSQVAIVRHTLSRYCETYFDPLLRLNEGSGSFSNERVITLVGLVKKSTSNCICEELTWAGQQGAHPAYLHRCCVKNYYIVDTITYI